MDPVTPFKPNCSEGMSRPLSPDETGFVPKKVKTEPMEWKLYGGHLTPGCASEPGIECPRCLTMMIAWELAKK